MEQQMNLSLTISLSSLSYLFLKSINNNLKINAFFKVKEKK